MRRSLAWVGLVLVFGSGLAWAWQVEVDRHVRITFCDVGQGDGIVIRQGRFQAIIDGGPDNGRLVDCVAGLLPPWDRTIELVVATHPDADHIGGLISLLEIYEVERVVTNGQPGETELAALFLQKSEGKRQEVARGDLIRFGTAELEILWPPEASEHVLGVSPAADRNDFSVVMAFRFGDFDMLLTGDAGEAVEREIWVEPVEVLKVSHHGSKTGTSAELLERAQPQLAVISVGKNWYGHPDQAVIGRLETVGAAIQRTDQAGSVHISTDGTGWSVVGR